MRDLRIIVLSIVLTATTSAANNAGTLFVEPWYEGRSPDELYTALDRLAAAGVIEIPIMCPRPYPRGYIVDLLSKGTLTDAGLAPADERYLNLLKYEFADELGVPEDEIKRPLIYKTYEDRLAGWAGGYGVVKEIYQTRDDSYQGISELYHMQGDSYQEIKAVMNSGFNYEDWLNIRQWAKLHYFFNRESTPERLGRARLNREGTVHINPYVMYLSIGWPNVSFQLGRDQIVAGPGYHNQLFLSRNAPPLDMFRFNLNFTKASFTAITARLEPWDDRYLSFHNVLVRALPWLDVGVSEAVIYQDPHFPSVYLNPFLPYYIEQNYREDRDNNIMGIQLDFHLPKGIGIYGEYITDGGFLATRKDKEPFEKRGLLFGTYFPLTISERLLDIRCEYTNVRNTVYSHKIEGNSYTYDGATLGSYTGPDADELWLWGGFRYWPDVETSAEFALRRKGEGDYSRKNYRSKDKFLTGIVERGKEIAFGVLWEDLPLNGAIHSKAGYTLTDNYEHIENNRRDYFWANVQVKLGFE
ncbi:MAG: capsule assembly Wzi family protein [bacterium]|nr:capsule assembly Wzi family protein [bacterium]